MEEYHGREDELYHEVVKKYVVQVSREHCVPLIVSMYARFRPDKLPLLEEKILPKYRGGEPELYRALCDKYIPTLTEDDPPLELVQWPVQSDERDPAAARKRSRSPPA